MKREHAGNADVVGPSSKARQIDDPRVKTRRGRVDVHHHHSPATTRHFELFTR